MPASDEKELQKPMMLTTESGFKISGALLDEFDDRIDIGEVTHVCDIPDEQFPEEEEPQQAKIVDTSFCAPYQRLKDLLHGLPDKIVSDPLERSAATSYDQTSSLNGLAPSD
ncbi:hypothetical protein MJO28_001615 [Puccinia striiformis f. sp. tritici]|uniref:Uncharacterized protein n=1 Tax=Puccinia striiformis f. sp. tritici TaxID=168172 RepID=A0ACC0EV50_9BASI|nr:hypothetical protein MJO28_001615 [Puccinia striiformis f. sp. tritici]